MSTNPHVLVCDDETHITRAASMKLSKAGLNVVTACDGQAGWEAIQSAKPGMVITDFQMPRVNGLELCGLIRSHPETADLPIVLLTAKGYEHDWNEIQQRLGLARVLPKPFSPRELLQVVQTILELETEPKSKD